MRSYIFRGALLALLFFSLPLSAKDAEVELPVLTVETLESQRFEGPQYVGSDSKGKVFILRTEGTLEVFPLEDDGLGKPRALQRKAMEGHGFVLDAAMDRHGDWIVLYGAEVRLFEDGKEKILPRLSWQPFSVALLNGEPIAGTFPFPMGRLSKRELRNPPLIQAADKDDWRTVVESERNGPPKVEERTPALHATASKIMTDSEDTIWLANEYRYRVVRYSKAGRELLSIEVGEAEVAHHEEESLEDARVALEEERARYANPERAKVVVNTAVTSILDLVEGEDGKIYLLTKAGKSGSLTLDRYDGVLNTLERTALGMTTPGAVSIASGKDGIYLVPFNGTLKRYLVPWEEIEQAAWVPVEGVKIDGTDAVVVAEEE